MGELWIGPGNESEDLLKDGGQGWILISLGFMSGIVTISRELNVTRIKIKMNWNISKVKAAVPKKQE